MSTWKIIQGHFSLLSKYCQRLCCRCLSCRCSCCLPNTKNYERDPLCLRSCRHFPAVYDFRGEESPSHPCVISISNLSVSSLDRVNSPSPPATRGKRIDVLLSMPRARADTWDWFGLWKQDRRWRSCFNDSEFIPDHILVYNCGYSGIHNNDIARSEWPMMCLGNPNQRYFQLMKKNRWFQK